MCDVRFGSWRRSGASMHHKSFVTHLQRIEEVWFADLDTDQPAVRVRWFQVLICVHIFQCLWAATGQAHASSQVEAFGLFQLERVFPSMAVVFFRSACIVRDRVQQCSSFGFQPACVSVNTIFQFVVSIRRSSRSTRSPLRT